MSIFKNWTNTRSKRWIGWILGTVLVLIGVMQIPAVRAWSSSLFGRVADNSVQIIEPTFGTFVHEVTVRGDISSSSNVDIKCEVRSNQGTMLLWVVDEGTSVKKGDLLAVLDSSALVDNQVSQEITCSSSEAELATAENDLKTALIAKQEYEEGTYLVSHQKLESAKIKAEEERSRLAEYLEHSKMLYQKGFITKQQLDADDFALRQADLDLKAANLDIQVLEDYTLKKSLISYDSNIKTAEAKKLAKENAHKNNIAKLEDINQQIEGCRILAPADGKVIYANETRGPSGSEFIVYEGATIRERQTFLRLPDPAKLQVVADVHEGKINYIKAGMAAVIRTDATASSSIPGTVIKVNDLPQPTNHWMGNVKEYRVTIKIESATGVLPGMTADVRIAVERQENVLMVPTHTVFEHGGKYYCILSSNNHYVAQELTLGSSNDKMVIVKSGLEKGTKILAAAFLHRSKVSLPKLAPGQTTTADIRTKVDSRFTELNEKAVQEAKKEMQEQNRDKRRPVRESRESIENGAINENGESGRRGKERPRLPEGVERPGPSASGERPFGPPPGEGGAQPPTPPAGGGKIPPSAPSSGGGPA